MAFHIIGTEKILKMEYFLRLYKKNSLHIENVLGILMTVRRR